MSAKKHCVMFLMFKYRLLLYCMVIPDPFHCCTHLVGRLNCADCKVGFTLEHWITVGWMPVTRVSLSGNQTPQGPHHMGDGTKPHVMWVMEPNPTSHG